MEDGGGLDHRLFGQICLLRTMLAESQETIAPGMHVRAVQQPSSTETRTNAADRGSWTVLDMEVNKEELVINEVDDCSTFLDGLAPPLRGLLMTSADGLE